MAISRMQQPRQMYGLGSFVKKAVRKVTKPITKVAGKLVPKEIAGIMRAAAPFLPPGYREAAYLLGTAKQTGRISPMDLALTAAPTFFSKTNVGQGIADRVGNLTLPGMDRNLRQVMVGTPGTTSRGPKILEGSPIRSPVQSDLITRETLTGFGDNIRKVEETSGIFGKGGKMFQFGGDQSIFDTKAGQTLLGKEKGDGTFGISLPKAAAFGTGILSAVTAAKTPEEAGEALVAQTGNSDDYERGVELFSALPKGIFDIQNPYRLNSANGGLMRTNYARGAGDKGVVNPFLPKPQGPVLPDDDKPFTPKPLKPIKMASGFGSYKDFIESTGDEELMDLYIEGLNSGDFTKLLDALKRKGYQGRDDIATGGRVGFALGTKPTPEESGLGGLPIEADMRYTGGFMPYGAVEKADDVPARLSKNEFVFTADAVRAAGGGSVNEGAKKMYQAMKQLEKKPEAKGMMA